jgi:hypothetical protein
MANKVIVIFITLTSFHLFLQEKKFLQKNVRSGVSKKIVFFDGEKKNNEFLKTFFQVHMIFIIKISLSKKNQSSL